MFALILAIGPAAAAVPLAVDLELARRALAVHDDTHANEALRAARAALAAAPLLVPGPEVARLHYLTGVAAWTAGLQSQAMTAWRQLWRLGVWAPEDDGLLDDEGMSVLRALQAEGGADEVPLSLSGDVDGALVLVDGQRLGDPPRLTVGDHLVQVRCPDGAVESTWAAVAARFDLRVDCPRRNGRSGAGVNEAVLAPDADEDLVTAALFGAYTTDAALHLGQLAGVEAEAPVPAPPEPSAPPAPPVPPAPPAPSEPSAPPGEPPVDAAELLACPGGTVPAGPLPGPDWAGPLTFRPDADGLRVTTPGARWLLPLPPGDVSVRLEGEGTFGLRVRYGTDTASGLAARVRPGAVELVDLPDDVVVGRDLPTAGRHVLRVDVRGERVVVRLDEATLLGGGAGAHPEGTVGVEAGPDAWIGRLSVCR